MNISSSFKTMCVLIGAGAALTGCGPRRLASPAPASVQTQAGVTASLTTPSPLHTGDDTLVVTLTDAGTGSPIGDANITGTADMLSPRLPGNPVTGRSQGNGVYQIPVRLGIATRYTVQVQVDRPGHTPAVFSFPLDVQQ